MWLITGSPERLVEQVYRDSAFLPRVRLIGSRITRCGGWVLTLRCWERRKWYSWSSGSVRR